MCRHEGEAQRRCSRRNHHTARAGPEERQVIGVPQDRAPGIMPQRQCFGQPNLTTLLSILSRAADHIIMCCIAPAMYFRSCLLQPDDTRSSTMELGVKAFPL